MAKGNAMENFVSRGPQMEILVLFCFVFFECNKTDCQRTIKSAKQSSSRRRREEVKKKKQEAKATPATHATFNVVLALIY